MTSSTLTQSPAILGGPRLIESDNVDPRLFHWPIVTEADEQAVIAVLRAGNMSGTDITRDFEARWGDYQGTRYNLGHCNGTMALLSAMFAAGVGRGDEIIVPSMTYWASALPAYVLGATPVFADIDPVSLCIDPADIAGRITPRTRAIVVVHYCGHPCDMDPIMAVAREHGLKVIEDVSHAHGALYKGRMVGSIGDIAGMSMMAGKSFAIGEAGMLSTNDESLHQRAVAFAHYERIKGDVHETTLREMVAPEGFLSALPLGGLKGRMNQTCAAMGRVQLAHYPQRIKAIQDAMNRFWDLLDGTPGLRAHRPTDEGSTMGGWYNPVGHYIPEELDGLPVSRFIEAVIAEGGRTARGVNMPLHTHPVLNTADVFHDGKPTRTAFAGRDVRQAKGSLPVTEALEHRSYGIPWFKHDQPEMIAAYAGAFRKVAQQADKLKK
jgi:dTDP-4-amino-4,6-dideoxygalactose transaminase